jgi:subtilisin family serine protease
VIRRILPINLVFTLFLASLAGFTPAQAKKMPQVIKYADDEIIIQYKLKPGSRSDNATSADFEEEFLEDIGVTYGLWAKDVDFYSSQRLRINQSKHFRKLRKNKSTKIKYRLAVLKLTEKMDSNKLDSLIKDINNKKFKHSRFEITNVLPNYLFEIDSIATPVTVELNDTYLKQQSSLKQIQPEKLWEYSKGKGVVVAVIDTGVDYTHEDLAANIWINKDEIPGNGKDDDNNGYVDDIRGWDFVDKAGYNCSGLEDCSKEDNDPRDVNGHGTHVAGIIAAIQDNNKGISGIAPEAKIMPLKAGYSAGRSGFLKTSDILEAITYAINNNADVINMSFAGAELSVLEDILNFAFRLGIVCVAAAGNANSSTKTYPAGLSSVIAVGSVDSQNYKAYYSNYGDWVTVSAPGTFILSTLPNNSYDFKSGTSMAAPQVAGLVALLKSKNKLKKQTVKDIKDLLLSSVTEVNSPNGFTGFASQGVISADIKFPLMIDNLELPSKVLVGSQATFKAQASDSASEIVEYEWNSDKEGYLGQDASLDLNFMTLGSQVIQVRAKNAQGLWSEPEIKVVQVVDSKNLNTSNYAQNFRFAFKRRKGFLLPRVSKHSKRRIKSFKWVSNVNGILGSKRTINLNRLNPGYHKISLSVQDINGNWSDPYQKVIRIN